MKTPSLKHLLTGLAMLAAAGLAIAITLTSKIADEDELFKKCAFAAYNCHE